MPVHRDGGQGDPVAQIALPPLQPFDRFPDAAILDQRLLWLVPLVFVVIRGAGYVSLDALLERWWTGSRPAQTGYASA